MALRDVELQMEADSPVLTVAAGALGGDLANWLMRLRRGGFGPTLEVRLHGPLSGGEAALAAEAKALSKAGLRLRCVALGDLSGMAATLLDGADERHMADGSSIRFGDGSAGFGGGSGEADALIAQWPEAARQGVRVEADEARAFGSVDAWPLKDEDALPTPEASLRVPQWRTLMPGGRMPRADLCRHVLALGEPGSGKSAGVVGPVIEAAMRGGSGVGCLLVIDPKDEHGDLMPEAPVVDLRRGAELPTVGVKAEGAAEALQEGRTLEAARRLMVTGAALTPGAGGATLGGAPPMSDRSAYWELEGARLGQMAVAFTLSFFQSVSQAFSDLKEAAFFVPVTGGRPSDPTSEGQALDALPALSSTMGAAGHAGAKALLDALDALKGGAEASLPLRQGSGLRLVDQYFGLVFERLPDSLLDEAEGAFARICWLAGVTRGLLDADGKRQPARRGRLSAWQADALEAMDVVRKDAAYAPSSRDFYNEEREEPADPWKHPLQAMAFAELFRVLFPRREGRSESILALTGRMLADCFLPEGSGPRQGTMPCLDWATPKGWAIPGMGGDAVLGDEARWRRDLVTVQGIAQATDSSSGTSGHYMGLYGFAKQCFGDFMDAGASLSFGLEPPSPQAERGLEFQAAADAKDGVLRAWRVIGGLSAGGGGGLYARALKAAYFSALTQAEGRVSDGRSMPLAMYVADEFQRLVTVGEGHGETSFLDVCRAYGVACVLATQSLSGLSLAVSSGDTTQAICGLTATKFVFRTSDEWTLRLLEWLAPRSELSVVAHRPASRLGLGECHAMLANGELVCRRIDLDAPKEDAPAKPRRSRAKGPSGP